ncbi:hypothetical protein OH77DRAFT_1429420 [Trametes cingulata]|nr:hypothetical protein OH77DRAFT_1429420 [Trametes cingulata]
MSDVPNTLWSWNRTVSASLGSMNIPFSVLSLVQNQVDQVLKETHRRDWPDWTHDDLRQVPVASRKVRKQMLLKDYPGLLSGLGAVSLYEDVWLPVYVLSVTIPRFLLAESSYQTDLRLCNVIWEHTSAATCSLSLFNNHLDTLSSLRHIVTEGESTKRRSRWPVGRHGHGFIRAVRVLMTELHNTANRTGSRGMTLRVGHSTGEFGWGPLKDGQPPLMFRQLELYPLSLEAVNGQSGFVFPFDQEASRSVRELSKESRVAAIYRERFLLRLSEKIVTNARATEPSHERPLIQSDEVLVTVLGLEPSCTPEFLFQGVWAIFPPQRQWTVSQARNLPDITFYVPTVENATRAPALSNTPKPHFYYRGYLIPWGPPLNSVGVNYSGRLDIAADGQTVTTTGSHFSTYLLHLSIALDTAFRTMPDLAVELAVDILTDVKVAPHSFAKVLSPAQPMSEEGTSAYRTAFETAWHRLDLAGSAQAVYPYVAGESSQKEELIRYLDKHPIPVQPHVRELLEKTGAYPSIASYAESLLLSAPGAVQVPAGTDRLRAALGMLFPALEGDLLSVRRYDRSRPRIAWGKETRTFVMSASLGCEEHQTQDGADPCFCWVGPTLLDAVASWRSKKDAQTTDISEAAVFHALLRCTATNAGTVAAVNAERGSSNSSNDVSWKEGLSTVDVDAGDDGELEYAEPPSPSPIYGALGPGFTPRTEHSPSYSYPSPVSPSLRYPRGRGRPSVFVITPLVPKHKRDGPPSASLDLTSPEADVVRSSDALPTTQVAIRPGHPSGVRDVADMSDIWQDTRRRVDSRVRAMSSYYAREVTALQGELSQAQSRASELESTLTSARTEQAAVLVTKEEAIAARDLALECKDDMLRGRDAQIRRLKDGLALQTRRAKAAEAEVRRLEMRDRKNSARLRAYMEEAEKIQRRLLSDMLRAKSVQGEYCEGELGDDDTPLGQNGPDGEPAVKRKRL